MLEMILYSLLCIKTSIKPYSLTFLRENLINSLFMSDMPGKFVFLCFDLELEPFLVEK